MSSESSRHSGNNSESRISQCALTVDLEDWRCALNPRQGADYRNRPQPDEEYLKESAKRILIEINAVESKATFFVLGEVARAVPEVVKDIARAGHEIASHSSVHLPPRMIPKGVFEKMLAQDMELLESITGRRPIGFRAPYFAIRRDEGWILDSLAKQGILYDSTIAPTWTPYWGIPSAPKRLYFPDMSDLAKEASSGRILEIPLSVWPSWPHLPGLPIAGGFYMRAWPAPLLARFMGANIRRGIPLVVYIHPGNLESQKERVADPTMRDRISQYVGSSRGLSSFRQVIRNFRFRTIEETFSEQIQQVRSELARR